MTTTTVRVCEAMVAYDRIARDNRPDWVKFYEDAVADPMGIVGEVLDLIPSTNDDWVSEWEIAVPIVDSWINEVGREIGAVTVALNPDN